MIILCMLQIAGDETSKYLLASEVEQQLSLLEVGSPNFWAIIRYLAPLHWIIDGNPGSEVLVLAIIRDSLTGIYICLVGIVWVIIQQVVLFGRN